MKLKQFSFYIDSKIVNVEIKITNNKNAYLKIIANKPVVLIPKNFPILQARNFVELNINKIMEEINSKEKNKLYSITDKFMYLFGVRYKLEFLFGYTTKNYRIDKNKIYLLCNDDNYKKILKLVLKRETKKYIDIRIDEIEKIVNSKKHELIYKYKKSAWGTNYIAENKISFSTRLAHFDYQIIDSVIYHEVIHSFVPSHNKKFWNLVFYYCPDYKAHRKKLNSYKTI